MAVMEPPVHIRRGHPVTVRSTTVVDVAIEGQTFALDVMRTAARLQADVATGDRARAINELGRLGLRGQEHFNECRTLAAEADE